MSVLHLDGIACVRGQHLLFADLSLALGCRPVFDDVDPKAQEAIDHILAWQPKALSGWMTDVPEGQVK